MRAGTLLALAAVPILVATVALGWIAAGERMGLTPFSDGGPRNSAEAAAMADAAALVQLLRRGENPLWAHPIRPELISSRIQRATTPEAAVASRRLAVVRLLEREGVIADDRTRRELACLAADLDLPEMVAHLAPQGAACTPGEALERVIARTQ